METAHYRISKSAWLEESEHNHVAKISRRSELMTGLTISTAESLQVVNYGIGGHYEPHYDFARVTHKRFIHSLNLYLFFNPERRSKIHKFRKWKSDCYSPLLCKNY